MVNSLSYEIANLYRANNYTVTTSLFTTTFLHSKYVNELSNANAELIAKLNLSSHTKFIVIGKYTNEFENGEMTKYISRVTLNVAVISCATKSQIDGFSLSAANGYDDKTNAENGAKEKVLSKYKANHLNL